MRIKGWVQRVVSGAVVCAAVSVPGASNAQTAAISWKTGAWTQTTDGKYSAQADVLTNISLTTSGSWGTDQTGSTISGLGGYCFLMLTNDPDGRPIRRGNDNIGLNVTNGYRGCVTYSFGTSGMTYSGPTNPGTGNPSAFAIETHSFSITQAIIGGSTTWGGQFVMGYSALGPSICGRLTDYKTAVRMHQATNCGNIQIYIVTNGYAASGRGVADYPVLSDIACYFSDTTDQTGGVAFHDLPGGRMRFDVDGANPKTQYLDVPINGSTNTYYVETSTGAVTGPTASGSPTPAPTPTPTPTPVPTPTPTPTPSIIAITPSSVPMRSTVYVTLKNSAGNWTSGTNFGVGGVAGCGLSGASRSSDNQTVVLTCYTGNATGTLEFGEGADSNHAYATVYDPAAPTPTPSPVATPSPSPAPGGTPTPTPTGSPSPSPCSATDTSDACKDTSSNFWARLFGPPSKATFAQWDAERAKWQAWGPVGLVSTFWAAWSGPGTGTVQADCSAAPQWFTQLDLGPFKQNIVVDWQCTTASSTMQAPGHGTYLGDLLHKVRVAETVLSWLVFGIGLLYVFIPRPKT